MKEKKVPMRKCIVSKEICEKKDLIRIVKDKNNCVSIDLTGKKNGRGAYLKKDINIINEAQKKNILANALGINIEDELFDELRNIIK